MTHLSQIVAVVKDKKERAAQARSAAEGKFGKPNIYLGISRTYTPHNDEDSERLPAESTQVQEKVGSIISDFQKHLVSLFDVVATNDVTNCTAKASIIVDGHVLLPDVPATYILFLEKQITELLSFAKKIPTLDSSEEWHHDTNRDIYATEPVETVRTKKNHHPFVLYEATKEHPAQVQILAEDIATGRWKTIKFSGALPAQNVNAIIDRLEKLQQAVKFAREEANRHEAVQQHVGHTVLSYIFG